jgi:hypothetical protein
MSDNTGGPAFPTSNGGSPDEGMTLRDYFAAQAMLGYMGPDYDMGPETRAREAYRLADAMLEARERYDD